MPFTTKDWKDGAAGGTKLNAAALEDLEKRVTDYADGIGAASQPVDSDLSAIAALSTTSYGRAFLGLADAAAGRTALGLGTAATQASSAFQASDSDLTAMAALTTTEFGRSFLTMANAGAARAALSVPSLAELEAHLADAVDAHDASAISYAGGTGMSATDLEAAIDELATEKANASEVAIGTATIACRLATAAALAANTRTSNKLEANSNGALANIDGVAAAVNDYVLVKDESTGANRGVYKVLALGGAGSKWSMERVPEMDASGDLKPGMLITVAEGTVNADSTWRLTTDATITLNTTSLAFAPARGPAIGCSVRLTSTKNVANLTGVPISWDDAAGSQGYNVGGCWSSGQPTRFVAPIPGLYVLSVSVWRDDENNTACEWALRFNWEGVGNQGIASVNHLMENTNGRLIHLSHPIRFTAAGQYVTAEVFQDSGGTRKIMADKFGEDFDVGRATFELIR